MINLCLSQRCKTYQFTIYCLLRYYIHILVKCEGWCDVREYREHFVAFLDILGFKAFINHEKCETIYQIFETIHARSKSSLMYNGVQIQAFEAIQHKILSDSIIVFIGAEIADAFAALLQICTQLQISLANRDDPILLRDGIAKGSLYYEDYIIFGQGLTQAYLLENNLAKYPRVIFTGDTLDAGRNVSKYMYPELEGKLQNFIEDEDGLYVVDYFPINYPGKLNEIKAYSDKLIHKCEAMLNSLTDASLREKYLWLRKQINKSNSHMSQLQELYNQEAKAKTNNETEQYNARFAIYHKQEQ